jgi:hypothetical protein
MMLQAICSFAPITTFLSTIDKSDGSSYLIKVMSDMCPTFDFGLHIMVESIYFSLISRLSFYVF